MPRANASNVQESIMAFHEACPRPCFAATCFAADVFRPTINAATWTAFVQAVVLHFGLLNWNEMPAEWLETDAGLSLAQIEAWLWKFERESDIFWSPL
jgi:hypothetical protein